jgi:dinuclear metal center YbgI/SA1388 family protein
MLESICNFLDEFLNIEEVEDYPNTLNGLHLQNDGHVTRIGAAVDASEAIIEMAINRQVDFLLVHHGLFWSGLTRLAGAHFRKIKRAISANVAICSAHLPLDLHPEIGNNILLARALELGKPEPFFLYKGQHLGIAISTQIDRTELINRLKEVLGRELWVCPAGPAQVRRVAILTGGGGAQVETVGAEGIDTYITGEGPHHTFSLTEELGMNLIYGGHYATEIFGVRALAERVALQFGLTWTFLDHPSGL